MDLIAYLGLFAAVVATWVAVSGPGEAALVSAGTVVGSREEIGVVLATAFLGAVTGSLAAFWLGRVGGRRLLLRRGPLLRWRQRTLARSEAFARRRSFLASLLGPGWFAGVNRISIRPFLAGTAISGLAWTLAIGLGSVYVGPSLISLFDAVGRWGTVTAAVLAVAAGGVFLLRRRVTRYAS